MYKYNKTWITQFNKNKNKNLYKEVLNEEFPDNKKCRDCGDVIYYYDSTFINSKNKLYPHKKSYLSSKSIFGEIYFLSICENCLIKKFPEYDTYNKSRVFNKLGDITIYAFDIPKEIAEKWKKQNYAITLDNLIIKHGEVEGNRIWENYLKMQSLTNTFDYKKEKYGWDEEKFKEFNLSRSITIENMVKKHGKEKGLKIWNNYIDRQKYTCSKEYFIKEYGEEFGLEKFENFIQKRTFEFGYSQVSQIIFENLKNKFPNFNFYFATNNGEKFLYDDENKITYHVDLFISDINLVIEFNGDVWHANPSKYNGDDIPIKFNGYKSLTANDIWERDRKRIKFLKTKVRDVIVIWEKDLVEGGMDKLVEELSEKIKSYE